MDREWKLGDDLHEQDNLLDGFTFDDLITALHCNEPVVNATVVKRTVKEILEQHLEDLNYLIDNNMDEIIQRSR